MTTSPPQKLGRYEILEELGRGAMGVVFRARDPLIGREVAIKTFRIGYSVKDEEMEQFRRRFIREAQSAGILSHPNIVTIHDVVEQSDEGMSFIAMEYVPGATLKHYLQGDRPPDHEFAVDVVAQIAGALDYAHAKGVVHRDIKPANILITQEHRVKITDFGIARLNTSNLTQDGQLLGTPNYMAPEQIMGKDLDHRADIFALGVLLYELLTRQKPFSGENLTTVTHRVVYEAFTPPEQFVPGLPSGFTPILNRALEKDPAARYQKAGDLAADLKAALTRARLDESAETVNVSKFTPPAPPPAKAQTPAATASPGAEKGKDKDRDLKGAPGDKGVKTADAKEAKDAKAGKGAVPAAKPAASKADAASRTVTLPSGTARGGAKSNSLWMGLGAIALVALGVVGFLVSRSSGEPEPAIESPAPVAAQASPEYLAAIAEGQQKLLSGDSVGAAAAFAQAEGLAPGDATALSLRQEAERQTAQKEQQTKAPAPVSAGKSPGSPGAGAPASPQPVAPDAAAAASPVRRPEPAVATPPELLIDFASELPQGVLTVYVGRDQVMRESFRFSRRQGIRSVGIAGSLQERRTVPPGDSSLRVIVALDGKPTRVVELQGNFRANVTRTLEIRIDAEGQAVARLN